MRSKSKHRRQQPVKVRRVLSESSTRLPKSHGSIRLNLSEALGNLPMTIDQDEILIEARLEGAELLLVVYCEETIRPNDMGGVYETIIPEDEES